MSSLASLLSSRVEAVAGIDPELPRYDQTYDDLVANFLPKARAPNDEMTAR